MDLMTIRTFFMWCTILNGGLLLLSACICVFANSWIYRVHGKWFPMPKETFVAVLYSFFGAYKLLFFVFNLVPFIALSILA